MKIFIILLLMSFSNSALAQLSDQVKATANHYQKEIDRTIGKKINFKIESKHEYTQEESKRLDYVIRTLGMSLIDIGKEKTSSRPWLAKNISTITFQNRSGDDQVHLKKENENLLIIVDLTKSDIKASEKEVGKVIKSWIPQLGPGNFKNTSKDQKK